MKKFRPMMEEALESTDSEISAKLYEIKKMTSNLVDNYTQPFHGLVKFAEPGTGHRKTNVPGAVCSISRRHGTETGCRIGVSGEVP